MANAVGSAAHTTPFDWRDLYLEALFENDRSLMCSRITEAQRALLHRQHELFADSSGRVEREAVESALNALFALRTCLGLEKSPTAA